MRVVFMGTPQFAKPTLEALIDSQHELLGIYTAPPRRANRGKKVTPSPIHTLANTHQLPVFTPTTLKTEQAQQELENLGADIAIVVAYGMLLPKAILDTPAYGSINIHPSALPRWRGAAPIQRTIMAGDTSTDICIMQMDEGLDTGDVLIRETYQLEPSETAATLEQRLSTFSAPLLLQALDHIEHGTSIAVPQSHEGVTYAKKILKDEAALDFSDSAKALSHKIHGLSPFPGAYIIYEGERIKWLRATIRDDNTSHPIGTVIDEQCSVQCANGIIQPSLLQRAGKKPVELDEFLRGLSIPVGTKLTSDQPSES